MFAENGLQELRSPGLDRAWHVPSKDSAKVLGVLCGLPLGLEKSSVHISPPRCRSRCECLRYRCWHLPNEFSSGRDDQGQRAVAIFQSSKNVVLGTPAMSLPTIKFDGVAPLFVTSRFPLRKAKLLSDPLRSRTEKTAIPAFGIRRSTSQLQVHPPGQR